MHNEPANRNVKKPIWKSWSELAGTDEHRRWADDEFPDREGLLDIDRRDFLKLAGAGMALAGAAGCRQIVNADPKAVPYVRAPEGMVAGKSVEYATAVSLAGYAVGVLVESHEGRPTKIEGNPSHPASLGSTDVFTQAEILGLYDPERSQSVIEKGEVSSWENFLAALRPILKAEAATGGAGIAVLSESITSPTLSAMRKRFDARFPNARWVQYEPVGRSAVHAGTSAAFGRALNPIYRFAEAQVVVSLDADFLGTMPGSIRYARDFAQTRRVRGADSTMSRLYAIESTVSVTGSSADHRMSVKPSAVELVARALHAAVSGGDSIECPVPAAAITAVAADLKRAGKNAVVVPGEQADPSVHVLAHAMNVALEAVGKTVVYTKPIESTTKDSAAEMARLVSDLAAGKVKTLVVLGGNPVYNAPADLRFADALTKADTVIRLGLYEDETSALSHWHLPETHALESWGDAVAHDGTVAIVQPLTAPLYQGKSAIEVVGELIDQPVPGREWVRQTWKALSDKKWRSALSEGVVDGTAAGVESVEFQKSALASLGTPAPSEGMEVTFRPDPTLYDGRFSGNAWLQELPKPVTTIVWDNAAMVSPATAKKLGLIPDVGESDAVNIAQYNGRRMVKVTIGDASLEVAAWILPGQPDDTIGLTLGGGRKAGGEVAVGRGFDTYALRTTKSMNRASGAKAELSSTEYKLAFTQPHHQMRAEYAETANRDIVRTATFAKFQEKGGVVHEAAHHELERANSAAHDDHEHGDVKQGAAHKADPAGTWSYSDKSVSNKDGFPSLYPEFANHGYNQWAMSIDLTTCIGCNACTIACQAENNIPVVGKDQVARGREMHWIRIDHYYEGDDLADPVSHFMPVPCMQCEKAPCEPVCPVAATIHSHEGLNQMVYNRCVGTRYCSNNCPYKVRRFNFLKWTEGSKVGSGLLDYYNKPQLKMLANPDVSVRGRGVMEKCTYCVQRINHVRIEAKKEGREIQDGEVVTACQQVCPTQAIVFGDLNNPQSEVSKLKALKHDYALLPDLNTRPRTTYLARIRNVNPDLETA